MQSQPEDYVLKLIKQLRQFLAEIAALRTVGRFSEAELSLIQSQQRLFGLPWSEIGRRTPHEQFLLLTRGELPSHAREKCLLQVQHMLEYGRLYWSRDERALAVGAWRFASILLELAGQSFPETQDHVMDRCENELRDLKNLPAA